MDNFNKLRKWLHLENDNLRMNKDGFRGIYSTKDIKKDDIILKIPREYIIQYSKINKNDIPSMSEKLYNSNSLIAMYLLIKSLKETTHWKPYLDTLPEKLDEYIYYYDQKKLDSLKNTSIQCKGVYNFNQHMKNIIFDSKIIYKWLIKKNILPEKYKSYPDFFKLFLRFRILVCSRIFGYMRSGKEETGMVPYADLFNHSHDPNTYWYYDDKMKSFIVLATKDIKKNTEIYDSYGEKTNIELMMYYGFTIKDNEHSKLHFVYKDDLIELDRDSTIESIDRRKDIIMKLKNILKHHKSVIKSKKITDNNILNIYTDEINIIKNIV